MTHMCRLILAAACASSLAAASPGQADSRAALDAIQPKIVKIFGAGGLRGLVPYQSGFLISSTGHVLTSYSYVLDSDTVRVVLDDGRRFEAKLLGADPRLELAVLKFEATDLPHFDLSHSAEGHTGMRVLALSNLFGVAVGDEQASVQHGIIAARSTLSARHGVFKTPYHGPIYVLDAMTNNPGASGGALTDARGNLLGMLGKELRDARTNIFLNYAVPVAQLRPVVDDILAGRARATAGDETQKPRHPLDLPALGLLLVPEVVDGTPPFVESIQTGTPAARAGLAVDDLVLFVNDRIVHSLRDVREACSSIEAGGRVHLTIRRGDELKTIVVEGPAPDSRQP